MTTITIPRPDDWHVHLRDGEMLKAVLPFTAKIFGRAIVMPNLKPAVTTAARAKGYRDEILAALPKNNTAFTPLMTVYLTDMTDAGDLEQGHKDGIVTAAKYYPAGATTNSGQGVTDIRKIYPVLERMQAIGMPLLLHGEVTDEDVDVFDRETVFIDKILKPLRRNLPGLKIVLEHITTRGAAGYVAAEGKDGKLAATITAHHLLINRNAMFKGGIRPHYYCLPIVKREEHRAALIKAATSGAPMFFLGTDTAPHAKSAKESACGCAGIFTAANAMALYAQAFDDAGAINKLEGFASRFGSAFYRLPVSKDLITLEKSAQSEMEIKPILTGNGQQIVPFVSPSPVLWRVAKA